ncbi:hypothetical protein [Hydrocarboniphaga effusa]|jgi:hypothetical protein|uniref:hypothetical protein n=1 Tax=Hydrocarboniphaga effusa TaxID=243629 RepID=UPI0035AE5DFC
MEILDWKERPFVPLEQMANYSALDQDTARKYGSMVKAAEISNRDYGYRYNKLSSSQKMQPPPSSHIHIFLGYLVVRKLGTAEQYETWMPDHVFEELYAASEP